MIFKFVNRVVLNTLIYISLLLSSNIIKAAEFEHVAGGLWSYSEVYSEDEFSSDGPYSDVIDDYPYVYTEQSAQVDDAYGYAYNELYDVNQTDQQSLAIRFYSYADANSATGLSNSYAYGYCSTEDQNTYGIFYKIMPQDSEKIGEDVRLSLTLNIQISSTDTTYAYVGGNNSMTELAVTKNQPYPVYDQVDPENTIWSYENLAINNSTYDEITKILTFPAKIGDTIGIFAENYSDVTLDEIGSGLIESDTTITLSLDTPLQGDVNLDGKVDLFDLARLGNNWLVGAESSSNTE